MKAPKTRIRALSDGAIRTTCVLDMCEKSSHSAFQANILFITRQISFNHHVQTSIKGVGFNSVITKKNEGVTLERSKDTEVCAKVYQERIN
jgi:hypothetical protein